MNYTDMALIVPSRGRPQNIERLYKALKETESSVNLYVGIDADDPSLQEYFEIAKDRSNIEMIVSKKRKRFGPTLDSIAKIIMNDYDYLAWCGDDHLPRTIKWDQNYRDALDLNPGIVYGNDLVQGQNIPTQMGFNPQIVKALGYAVPKGFIHLFIDNYFLELGKALDWVTYLPDVIFEHLHPCVGMAEQDKTYQEANSPENWSNDRRVFEEYMSNQLELDARKVLRYVSGGV